MASAPTVARSRRAWRAGLRPESAWLVPGLVLLAAGAWLQPESGTTANASTLAPALVAEVDAVLRSTTPELADAEAISSHALTVIAGGVAVTTVCVLALALVAAGLLRRFGPTEPSAAAELAPLPVSTRRVAIVGAVVLAVIGWLVVRPAIAGGARAADASFAGLWELWGGTLAATATTMGLALVAVGAFEAWRSAGRIRQIATPTPEQARDDARRAGTRRR